MRLVEIDGRWINPEQVASVEESALTGGVDIYLAGIEDPFVVTGPVDDVVAKLIGKVDFETEKTFMGVPLSRLDKPGNEYVKKAFNEYIDRHPFILRQVDG